MSKTSGVDITKARSCAIDNVYLPEATVPSAGIGSGSGSSDTLSSSTSFSSSLSEDLNSAIDKVVDHSLFLHDMFYHPELKELYTRLRREPSEELDVRERQYYKEKLEASIKILDPKNDINLVDAKFFDSSYRNMSGVAANVLIALSDGKNNADLQKTIESQSEAYTKEILSGSIKEDYSRADISIRGNGITTAHRADAESENISTYIKNLSVRAKELGLSQEQASILLFMADQSSLYGTAFAVVSSQNKSMKYDIKSTSQRTTLLERNEKRTIISNHDCCTVRDLENPEKLTDGIALVSQEIDITALTSDKPLSLGLGSTHITPKIRVTFIDSSLDIDFPKEIECDEKIDHIREFSIGIIKSAATEKTESLKKCAALIASKQPKLTNFFVAAATELFGYEPEILKAQIQDLRNKDFIDAHQRAASDDEDANLLTARMLVGFDSISSSGNNGNRYTTDQAAEIISNVVESKNISTSKEKAKQYHDIIDKYCAQFAEDTVSLEAKKRDILERIRFRQGIITKLKTKSAEEILKCDDVPEAQPIVVQFLYDMFKTAPDEYSKLTAAMLRKNDDKSMRILEKVAQKDANEYERRNREGEKASGLRRTLSGSSISSSDSTPKALHTTRTPSKPIGVSETKSRS